MLCKIHLPTDQYAFVEFEVDVANEHEAVHTYYELKEYVENESGLTQGEWIAVIDDYLQGKGVSEAIFSRMSRYQRDWLHDYDKAQNRLKYKKTKEN